MDDVHRACEAWLLRSWLVSSLGLVEMVPRAAITIGEPQAAALPRARRPGCETDAVGATNKVPDGNAWKAIGLWAQPCVHRLRYLIFARPTQPHPPARMSMRNMRASQTETEVILLLAAASRW